MKSRQCCKHRAAQLFCRIPALLMANHGYGCLFGMALAENSIFNRLYQNQHGIFSSSSWGHFFG